MHHHYKTRGTCSRFIEFDITDNILRNVQFTNGCDGNLKGIGILVEGMDIDSVIRKLEGIRCENKPTSCPDQLAQALKAVRGSK
mgnify:CR=1 FL=1